MPEGNDLPRTGDEGTDDILDQMELEGVDVPVDDKEETPASPEKEEQPDDKEDAAPESSVAVDDEEEGGEPEPEEEEEVEPPLPAQRTSVPVSKYEYERSKRLKLESELKKLKESQSMAEVKARLEKVAQEENVPVERLMAIVNAVKDSVMSPEMKENARLAADFIREKQETEHQDVEFEHEFSSTVLPLLKREDPRMTDDDLQEVHDALYEEAFRLIPQNEYDPVTGKPRRSLVHIYLGTKGKPMKRTGEHSRVGSLASGKKSSSMSMEDIASVESDEEFDRLSSEAGQSSSMLVGGPKRI